jgi:5-keto 4-deoxyuronate isomerase
VRAERIHTVEDLLGMTSLSQAPIWCTYCPAINDSREGTHVGLLV